MVTWLCLTSRFWKSRFSFFFVCLFYFKLSWGLPFHWQWTDFAPLCFSFPSGYGSRWNMAALTSYFVPSEKGRAQCPFPVQTSKWNHIIGIHSFEFGGTRERDLVQLHLEKAPGVHRAHLCFIKQRPSAASQAVARQQTLTRNNIYFKLTNKNKRKNKRKLSFTKMKILWIYCIIVKSLSIDFRKRERKDVHP